jgi:hypothetical protein
MVTPVFEKEDTVIRNAIPSCQRLSATVRFLCAGQVFEDLKFTNAIAPQTLSTIAPQTLSGIVRQTCEVIIWALRVTIKVINSPVIKLENYEIFEYIQS